MYVESTRLVDQRSLPNTRPARWNQTTSKMRAAAPDAKKITPIEKSSGMRSITWSRCLMGRVRCLIQLSYGCLQCNCHWVAALPRKADNRGDHILEAHMRRRCWTPAIVSSLIAVVVLSAVPLFAQSKPQAAKTATAARASDARDLEGIWGFATLTPLQRPNQ